MGEMIERFEMGPHGAKMKTLDLQRRLRGSKRDRRGIHIKEDRVQRVIPEVISNGETGTEIEMQSLLETNVPSGGAQNGRERPSGRIQIYDRVQPRLTPDFDNRDIAGIRGVSDLRRRTTFVRNNEHHRFTLKAKRHALGQMRREFLQCQEELSEKKSQKARDNEFPIWSTAISSIQSQKGSGVAAYFRLVQESTIFIDPGPDSGLRTFYNGLLK